MAAAAFAREREGGAGADGVCAPALRVVLLAVDAPKFGGQVVDEVEVADAVEGGAQLPIVGDVKNRLIP